jgi:soluble lytic murein transglycosylase-like protein
MLESVIDTRARIADIRSHFRSFGPAGVVHVAPHTVADEATALGNGAVTQAFSTYLSGELDSDAASKTEAGLATSNRSVRASGSYDEMIQNACAHYNMDPALVKAVIKAESGFNAQAISHSGAQGLMQLMPRTANALGVSDPLEPYQNIMGGTRYLKGQMDRFGDVRMALAAYNAGPAAVTRYGGVPPYRETQNYVNKVLLYREQFSSQ